jgi:hypothetical protein
VPRKHRQVNNPTAWSSFSLSSLRGSVATFDRVEEGATAIATLSTKNHEVLSRVRDRSHVCLACCQASVHRFLYRKNGCDLRSRFCTAKARRRPSGV